MPTTVRWRFGPYEQKGTFLCAYLGTKFEFARPPLPKNGKMLPTRREKTQSFYNDFFEVFDVQRRTVARYERMSQNWTNDQGQSLLKITVFFFFENDAFRLKKTTLRRAKCGK